MKCQTCQNKPASFGMAFCKKCSATLSCSNHKFCDNCSQQLQKCQVCGDDPNGSSSSSSTPSGPTPYSTKVTARDDGKTIKGVRTGEYVEVTLDEDQYTGKEWGVNTKNWRFSTVSSGQFTQNAKNPQYGQRTFVFCCDSAGEGDIELHEVQRSYSYWGGGSSTTPVPGGKTFKVTIEIG